MPHNVEEELFNQWFKKCMEEATPRLNATAKAFHKATEGAYDWGHAVTLIAGPPGTAHCYPKRKRLRKKLAKRFFVRHYADVPRKLVYQIRGARIVSMRKLPFGMTSQIQFTQESKS